MECESKICEIKKQTKKTGSIKTSFADACNVFSTIWLRCSVQINNGFDRFVLDGRPGFLFYFRLFLVIIYFAYTNIK